MIYRRRHVFHIAGYDPTGPDEHRQRFGRQLEIFKQTWNLRGSASDLEGGASFFPRWTVTTRGPNWQTETTVELLAWDDFVKKAANGSRLTRLLRVISTYFNLLFSGTLLRYMLANDRYFLFTIVPVLQATALGLLAWWAAFLLIGRFGWSPTFEYATAVTFGYSLFLLLLEWPGRRWRIYQAFDDWILSLDYVYGKRKDLEARLDQFSARFVDCVHQSKADEIVLVGHSLGAIFAVDILARALDADDRVRRSRVAVSLVTVGATIPKCALHPAADRLRAQINRIVNEPLIFWVEYQSRADAISFYRFHPVKLRRIKQNEDLLHARPVIRRLQIKDMLKAETFKKMRFKVLRLHYQFVSANDRRAPYDYFMMICGPVLSIKWAAARLGILEFFSDSDSAGVAEAPDSAS